jgi:polysaccharide chain length determinant protein (PEP-CTERM system associated)
MPETEKNIHDTMIWVVGLLSRRRWWILCSVLATSLAVSAYMWRLPNRYSSEATLLIVQQPVSTTYVPAATTASIADAVRMMTREILSRPRLLEIIDEFGLYRNARSSVMANELVERMRQNDVSIEPLDKIPDFSAFKISFTAEDPIVAHRVTQRLTHLFIDETVKARGNQVATTTGFLTEQVEAAKHNLLRQEQRLRDFKMGNGGELPEQQAANLQMLTDLRSQLFAVMASATRAQQQRASLDSVVELNLARLRSERAGMLNQFTAKHPAVMKKDEEIAATSALLARLRTPDLPSASRDTSAGLYDPSVAQLKSQVDASTAEIARLAKDEQSLRSEMAKYEQRVSLAPVREQQLATLLRDYQLYQRDYADLVSKQLQSQLTASLEKRQEGQQFRLVDPPTLPVNPTSPKRFKLSLAGVVAGTLLGFAIAFFVDSRDRSFHTEHEAKEYLNLPLISLPMFLTPSEERKRKWQNACEWAVGSIVLLAIVAVQYYVYKNG